MGRPEYLQGSRELFKLLLSTKISGLFQKLEEEIEEFIAIHYSKMQGIKDAKDYLLNRKNRKKEENMDMDIEDEPLMSLKIKILQKIDFEHPKAAVYKEMYEKVSEF